MTKAEMEVKIAALESDLSNATENVEALTTLLAVMVRRAPTTIVKIDADELMTFTYPNSLLLEENGTAIDLSIAGGSAQPS